MLGLLGSAAEFERAIIRERQAEGVAEAKKRGVHKGRARVLTKDQVAQAREWVEAGIPKTKVAKRLGVGRTTLYEYIKVENPRKTRPYAQFRSIFEAKECLSEVSLE